MMTTFRSATARSATALAVALALTTAACGAPSQAGENSGPVEVRVTVTDFKVESSRTSFQSGVSYRFVVTNNGKLPHELMIVPPMAVGAMPMEKMHELALGVVDEDDLPPGSTQEMTVTFDKAYPSGKLEFACHVPGHYDAGMHLPMTVTK